MEINSDNTVLSLIRNGMPTASVLPEVIPAEGVEVKFNLGSSLPEARLHGRMGVVYRFTPNIATKNSNPYHDCYSPDVMHLDHRMPYEEVATILRQRVGYHGTSIHGDMIVDMRCVMNAIGAFLSDVATRGIEMAELAADEHAVYRVADGNYVIAQNETAIHFDARMVPIQCITFCGRLCRLMGVPIPIVYNMPQNVANAFPTGVAQISAASRLASRILGVAQSNGVAGAHMVAYCAGICKHFSLNGHTDEGGVCRTFMRTLTFPTPSGLILERAPQVSHGSVFLDIQRASVVVRECMVMTSLAAVAIGKCDPGFTYNGVRLPTIVRSTSGDAGLLRTTVAQLFVDWFISMGEHIADCCGLSDSHSGSVHAACASGIYAALGSDRHLAGSALCPSYWVETSMFWTRSDEMCYKSPCYGIGHTCELPLFSENAIVQCYGTETDNIVLCNSFNPRLAGIVYLTHETANDRDGLASILFEGATLAATHSATGNTEGFIFPGDRDIETLRQLLWNSPHCPVPKPFEGVFGNDGAFVLDCSHLEHYVETPLYSRPVRVSWGSGMLMRKHVDANAYVKWCRKITTATRYAASSLRHINAVESTANARSKLISQMLSGHFHIPQVLANAQRLTGTAINQDDTPPSEGVTASGEAVNLEGSRNVQPILKDSTPMPKEDAQTIPDPAAASQRVSLQVAMEFNRQVARLGDSLPNLGAYCATTKDTESILEQKMADLVAAVNAHASTAKEEHTNIGDANSLIGKQPLANDDKDSNTTEGNIEGGPKVGGDGDSDLGEGGTTK